MTDIVGVSGIQIFNDDGSPDLFALYGGDLGEKIMSYISDIEHLCKLDTINKQFQGLTEGLWEIITNNRYGMKNGKQGWIMGTSLLRKPVYIHIDKAPGYDNDMYYAGAPYVTIHNTLVAINTDEGTDDGAPEGVGLYNAQDLSYIGPQAGEGWKTTMAGPDGDETFVTADSHELEFRRENIVQRQLFSNIGNVDGIPVIGSETHVIAVIGNTLNVYRVVAGDTLVELCQSVPLGRGCHEDEFYTKTIKWGINESEFVIYQSLDHFDDTIPGSYEISVWSLDAEEDCLAHTLTIEAGIKLTNVALAEDFIVGASSDRKIHVWDRHTKEKKPFVLCDAEEEDELEECICSLCLSCHGHMLVSTSHFGCALCVWNIKTGQLLRICNDAEEEHNVELLPEGNDVSSMAYLTDLNCYICMEGYLNIWTFPTNQNQKDMALSIRRREQDLRRTTR